MDECAGKTSSSFIPGSPSLSSSLFYFLYSLPRGLWGLNANVLVLHLLLDPTGFIKSNQLRAPLSLRPRNRHGEKNRNMSSCTQPCNFSRHFGALWGTWAVICKHQMAKICVLCNIAHYDNMIYIMYDILWILCKINLPLPHSTERGGPSMQRNIYHIHLTIMIML